MTTSAQAAALLAFKALNKQEEPPATSPIQYNNPKARKPRLVPLLSPLQPLSPRPDLPAAAKKSKSKTTSAESIASGANMALAAARATPVPSSSLSLVRATTNTTPQPVVRAATAPALQPAADPKRKRTSTYAPVAPQPQKITSISRLGSAQSGLFLDSPPPLLLVRTPSPISSQDMINNVKQLIQNNQITQQQRDDQVSKRILANLDPQAMIKLLKSSLHNQAARKGPEPAPEKLRLKEFRQLVDVKRISTPVTKVDEEQLWLQHTKNIGLYESLGHMLDATGDDEMLLMLGASAADSTPQIVVSQPASLTLLSLLLAVPQMVSSASPTTVPSLPRMLSSPLIRPLSPRIESLESLPITAPLAAATTRVAAAPRLSVDTGETVRHSMDTVHPEVTPPPLHPTTTLASLRRKPPPELGALDVEFSDIDSQPTFLLLNPLIFPKFPEITKRKRSGNHSRFIPEPLLISDIGEADDSDEDCLPEGMAPAVNQQPAVTFKKTMRKTKKKDKKLSFNENKPWKNHTELNFMLEQERKRYEGVWVLNRGQYVGSYVVRLTGVDYSRDEMAPQTNEDPSLVAATQALSEVDDLQDYHGIHHAEINQLMAGPVVKRLWERLRLPQASLEQIWLLVDYRHDGTLSKAEFLVGMWLIDQCLYGRKLPKRVDQGVWDRLGYFGLNLNVNVKKKRIP